jgi:hypothetical protein
MASGVGRGVRNRSNPFGEQHYRGAGQHHVTVGFQLGIKSICSGLMLLQIINMDSFAISSQVAQLLPRMQVVVVVARNVQLSATTQERVRAFGEVSKECRRCM